MPADQPDDNDDTPLPCSACEGKGRVKISNAITTDEHTKWQQVAYEQVSIDCPVCDGSEK